MSKVLIVGAGAAGMMAAVAAAECGHHVEIFEKNEKLGKKVFITGKGRCNVTNAADMETLMENVCTNPRFLYSAFYGYDNRAVMDFLEEAGCPLKVERGDRVFPVSDRANDVIQAFARVLKRKQVDIHLNTQVKDLVLAESGGRIAGILLADGRKIIGDAVIVCTGGLSYPSTGSTGDGLNWARRTGHNVTDLRPSLVPVEIAEDWCRNLMGLSLKNVSLRLLCGKKELYKEQGEMLFTHFGVSGPLVLSASCYLGKCRPSKKEEDAVPKLVLDLKPALSEEQLDKRLLRDFEEQSNKQFKNALGGLFPFNLIPVMVMLSDIDGEKKVHEITRQERKAFVTLIKNLTMTVKGTRPFPEAIITQGGVSVKDVDPSTMESKRMKGLYFAGEVLDLDAKTGGYNLQIAWSTGHLAGMSISVE